MNPIPVNVLVVDDETTEKEGKAEDIVELSDDDFDYKTDTAADGEEALNKLKQRHFHIILLDIEMPNMNGLTFLKELRQYWKSPRVIIYTWYVDNNDYLRHAIEGNIFGLLSKKLSADEQMNKLEELLREAAKDLFEVSPDVSDLYNKPLLPELDEE